MLSFGATNIFSLPCLVLIVVFTRLVPNTAENVLRSFLYLKLYGIHVGEF